MVCWVAFGFWISALVMESLRFLWSHVRPKHWGREATEPKLLLWTAVRAKSSQSRGNVPGMWHWTDSGAGWHSYSGSFHVCIVSSIYDVPLYLLPAFHFIYLLYLLYMFTWCTHMHEKYIYGNIRTYLQDTHINLHLGRLPQTAK